MSATRRPPAAREKSRRSRSAMLAAAIAGTCSGAARATLTWLLNHITIP
ncbi:hypothetical protein ACIQXA_32895 [Streptomyces massasporeus]|jgi:hypothetical protein